MMPSPPVMVALEARLNHIWVVVRRFLCQREMGRRMTETYVVPARKHAHSTQFSEREGLRARAMRMRMEQG